MMLLTNFHARKKKRMSRIESMTKKKRKKIIEIHTFISLHSKLRTRICHFGQGSPISIEAKPFYQFSDISIRFEFGVYMSTDRQSVECRIDTETLPTLACTFLSLSISS